MSLFFYHSSVLNSLSHQPFLCYRHPARRTISTWQTLANNRSYSQRTNIILEQAGVVLHHHGHNPFSTEQALLHAGPVSSEIQHHCLCPSPFQHSTRPPRGPVACSPGDPTVIGWTTFLGWQIHPIPFQPVMATINKQVRWYIYRCAK